MKIWRCPTCDSGVRAPAAMRRDDVRRFCLDCSQRTGFLVPRVNVSSAKRKAEREAKERAEREQARQAREALHRSVVAPGTALISPAGVYLDLLESGRSDMDELRGDAELRRLIDTAIASKGARFPRRKIVAMYAKGPESQWCRSWGIAVRYAGEFQYHCLFCEEMPFTLGKVGSTISHEFSNRIRHHGAVCAMQYLVMLDHDFSNAVNPSQGAT